MKSSQNPKASWIRTANYRRNFDSKNMKPMYMKRRTDINSYVLDVTQGTSENMKNDKEKNTL